MSETGSLYRVAIYLKGDNLNPDEITQLLGVKPARSHRRGDRTLTQTGVEAVKKTGLWSLSVESRSKEVSEMLIDLFGEIGPNVGLLRNTPSIEEAYFDVFMAENANTYGGGTCEFGLGDECLLKLASVGIPARFTVALIGRP